VLKKKLLEKWLEALREGDYKQGGEFLRTSENCYCCLGVLADIHPYLKYESNEHEDSLGWYTYSVPQSDPDHNEHYLPTYILPLEVQRKLGEMNDSGRYDFSQMADFIEENIKPEEEAE